MLNQVVSHIAGHFQASAGGAGHKGSTLAAPQDRLPLHDSYNGGGNHLLSGRPLTQYKLCIAGITIQFDADGALKLVVPESQRDFMVKNSEPDFHLKVHYGQLPPLSLEEKLFDSGAVWALYSSHGLYEITFSSDIFGPVPYQAAIIDSQFKSGDLYVRPTSELRKEETARGNHEDLPHVVPTAYPLDEVLMVNLLSRGRGVEFHACGINLNGRGYIFAGTSGTGKSTLGHLWQGEKDTIVLSDERIIVRQIHGRFWMYGTPWYSDARVSSPECVPLEKVFLINHSSINNASLLKAGDTASRLFVCCFPTFWDEDGLTYTLGLVGKIAEQVPCYELGFIPNESILEFIKDMTTREFML